MRWTAPLLLLAACRTEPDKSITTDSAVDSVGADSGLPVDEDGDGYTAQEDCDESNSAVNPGALELCDSLDNDCDGETDDGATDALTWYADGDQDGYGTDKISAQSCTQPTGYAAQAGDCNDSNAAYYPGASEADCTDPNDYNCDGSVGFADGDDDGYAACEECDDSDGAIHPKATELCDTQDNDCDGDTDEPDAADASTWYQDIDGDGYGDADFTTKACTQPSGYDDDKLDCDDTDASIYPKATELCDGQDNDCDGDIDTDATDKSTWYLDADEDGYGKSSSALQSCDQPSGYVSNSGDCDDTEELAWTGATETCDYVDNDCDGSVDEGKKSTWYLDADGDGYGDDSATTTACTAPTSSYVAVGGDCDDSDTSYNPGATAGCDGEDYDCDGSVDNDADSDGYADSACGGDDCDDTDASLIPEPGGGCAIGTSCDDILSKGKSTGDGTYTIDWDGYGTGDDPVDVYCDMTTDGGGWTLVGYSYAGSTSTSTSNYNFRSLMCGGGTYQPESRGKDSAALDATTIVQASTEIAFSLESGGVAVTTGNMSAYAYAYKFTIPYPSKVHFKNHSYRGPYWSTSDTGVGPCTAVTVTGLVGETTTATKYTLQNVLGTSWTDAYPTGYGVSDNSSCVNHNGGPFITSIHSGSHNYAIGTTTSECDISLGSVTYTHRGNYYLNSTGQTGSAAIWLR